MGSYARESLHKCFRSLAHWVWCEQNKSFRHDLKLQEETLTEILLLRMAEQLTGLGMLAYAFKREEERAVGADWEWFYCDDDCRAGFRVQAKRLYFSGRYEALKEDQANKLICKAKESRNNPIYVFYNHCRIKNTSNFMFEDPDWGCSIAKASFIMANAFKKTQGGTSSKILHQGMKPWHTLFADVGNCSIKSAINELEGESEFIASEDYPKWSNHILHVRPGLTSERIKLRFKAHGETSRQEILYQPGEFLNKYLAFNYLNGVVLIDARKSVLIVPSQN